MDVFLSMETFHMATRTRSNKLVRLIVLVLYFYLTYRGQVITLFAED